VLKLFTSDGNRGLWPASGYNDDDDEIPRSKGPDL